MTAHSEGYYWNLASHHFWRICSLFVWTNPHLSSHLLPSSLLYVPCTFNPLLFLPFLLSLSDLSPWFFSSVCPSVRLVLSLAAAVSLQGHQSFPSAHTWPSYSTHVLTHANTETHTHRHRQAHTHRHTQTAMSPHTSNLPSFPRTWIILLETLNNLHNTLL